MHNGLSGSRQNSGQESKKIARRPAQLLPSPRHRPSFISAQNCRPRTSAGPDTIPRPLLGMTSVPLLVRIAFVEEDALVQRASLARGSARRNSGRHCDTGLAASTTRPWRTRSANNGTTAGPVPSLPTLQTIRYHAPWPSPGSCRWRAQGVSCRGCRGVETSTVAKFAKSESHDFRHPH